MKRTYQLYTYDVWGNAEDGYQVNDVYPQGEVTINAKPTTYNAGTEHEFTAHDPTDLQLSRAVGARNCEWEGESDYTLYATSKRDGKPVCELRSLD